MSLRQTNRKQYDHERYMASREQRCKHQREYFRENREAIRERRRMNGPLKYGAANERTDS